MTAKCTSWNRRTNKNNSITWNRKCGSITAHVTSGANGIRRRGSKRTIWTVTDGYSYKQGGNANVLAAKRRATEEMKKMLNDKSAMRRASAVRRHRVGS